MPPQVYLLIFYLLSVYANSTKYCSNGSKQVKCDHGSCKNESQLGSVKCVCDRGWSGPTCESCGGRLRLSADQPGEIVDGNHNYSLNTKCTWLVEGQAGVPIQLSLRHFATECSWDHLYVYDGDSVYSPLVAAFSGLMVPDQSSNVIKKKDLPDLTVRSGSAYLHFYSDAAYNMSGFNIAYRSHSCPQNCSGHGTCNMNRGWSCDCNASWSGPACNKPRCPRNCSHNGICEAYETQPMKCNCYNKKFRGIDCSIPEYDGVWEEVSYEANFKHVTYTPWGQEPDKSSLGRASHKSVLIGDHIWIVGGYDFDNKENVDVLRYDVINEVMDIVDLASTSDIPRRRYGHSLVTYEKRLFMFGGVIDNAITDELWRFDTETRVWDLWPNPHPARPSYAVVGHTAHLIDNVMYVVFGHSPLFGYFNLVQECSMYDYKWSIHNTTGAIVKGGYGHTSVYDPGTGLIYIHGGYHSGSTSAYHLSDSLYSFDPKHKHWRILTSSSLVSHPQYLHSSVITAGLILVYGGNTHNDTSISHGAKCYSSNFIAYDIECDSWFRLPDPVLDRDIARFGHVAEMYSYKDTKINTVSYYMYVFGGFNGQMLSDLFKYTPGNCQAQMDKESCLSSRQGVLCVWVDNRDCLEKTNANLRKESKSVSHIEDRVCTKHSQDAGVQHCSSLKTCPSCVETSYDCVWCGKSCVYQECSKTTGKEPVQPARKLSMCLANYSSESSSCSTLHNCNACLSNSNCTWDNTSKECRYTRSVAKKTPASEDICKLPCHKHGSCENCTSKGCMWCSNQVRCVEPNAYVASFPYGQCMEWTTNHPKCPATRCSELRTCNECQTNPSCGWCYDQSETGLGLCMEGSLRGALNTTQTCPPQRWYFVDCPLCQCNGHSTCKEGTSDCVDCQHLTKGDQCQYCKDGYFGTPTNGGNCSVCECNGQADTCNRDNGSCFCRTRGVTGDKCNICDKAQKYFGNPKEGGTCYFELATDYQFTFDLTKDQDHQYTQINFLNIPLKHERDVDFQINCSSHAKINITIRIDNVSEEVLISELPCTSLYKEKFSHKKFPFGRDHNTTFYVYVYGFHTPFWLLIAFSQFPQIDLLHFFVTFISCFLSLLLIAVVLWKVKQKYDLYRRAQRMRVEREQWANRPFGATMTIVDNDNHQHLAQEMMVNRQPTVDSNQTTNNHKPSKHKNKGALGSRKPGYIAIEPLQNNRTGIATVILKLPTGDDDWAPAGHCGIALCTALVSLGSSQRSILEQTKMDKNCGKVQINSQSNCQPEYIV